MKRINDLLNIFSAAPGEEITVTTRARNTVHMATHSDPLASGTPWTVVQSPTPADPVDVRRFKMPAADESFAIVYQFSPPQGSGKQFYEVTFGGAGGTSDGPRTVARPPLTGQATLAYVFTADTSESLATHDLVSAHWMMAVEAAGPVAKPKKAAKKAAKKSK